MPKIDPPSAGAIQSNGDDGQDVPGWPCSRRCVLLIGIGVVVVLPAMYECPHVASDGVRLAVTVSGSGPSLLFLHGEGYGRHDWDAVRTFLEVDYTCIAADQRGWGDSGGTYDDHGNTRRVIEDVIELARTAPAPPMLVGHSWGAKIAIETAAQTEGLVRGVFCVDGILLGSASKDALYALVSVPMRFLWGTESPTEYDGHWVSQEALDVLCARYPAIAMSWIKSGHDIPNLRARELAIAIRDFDADIRAGHARPANVAAVVPDG